MTKQRLTPNQRRSASTTPVFGHCWCGCGNKTDTWQATDRKRGRIKGEHKRYIYNHHRRASLDSIDIVARQKLCPSCNQTKVFEAFGKNVNKIGGVDYECRECKRQRALIRESSPDAKLNAYFRFAKREYGVTRQEYEQMERQQKGCCAICGVDPKAAFKDREAGHQKLHIDHWHDETKEARGLLCFSCNVGLGWFGDSTGLLEAALRYLRTTTKQRHNND